MKNTNKILAFLLAFAMVLTFVPEFEIPTALAAETEKDSGLSTAETTEASHLTEVPEGYVGIYTKADLNNVRNDLAGNYILMNDIEFTDADFAEGGAFYNSGAGWEPIGSSSSNAFTGTLDGNGYAIKNLYINISSESGLYAGLFGYVSNGKIQNLGMANSHIMVNAHADFSSAGGIVGYNYGGTITNCYNTGVVSASARYAAYVGGIMGINAGTITNCHNTGSVSSFSSYSASFAGGIAGQNDGAITNCYNEGTSASSSSEKDSCSGGIAGFNTKIITNCYNTGSVSASSRASNNNRDGFPSAGGIVGCNSGGTITNCHNTDSVTSENYAGGIVGYNYGGTITNCYNTGSVSSVYYSSFAGGIAGYHSGTIENCYNTGSVSSSTSYGQSYFSSSSFAGGIAGYSGGMITNCYNTGTASVLLSTERSFAGGIVGKDDGIITTCYYLDIISNSVGSGTDAATKCTIEEMMQQSTFVGFDFTETWTLTNASPYPVLRRNNENFAGGFGDELNPYVLGDVDGNEQISSDDAVYLLGHTLFAEYYPLSQPCDFDGNGQVNSDDAVYLLGYTLFPEYYPLH